MANGTMVMAGNRIYMEDGMAAHIQSLELVRGTKQEYTVTQNLPDGETISHSARFGYWKRGDGGMWVLAFYIPNLDRTYLFPLTAIVDGEIEIEMK